MIYGGVEVWLHTFSILALDGGEWPFHALNTLHPWKEPWYTLDRRLGGPRASVDMVIKRKILLLL
jgi:hypothetical protein